LEAIIITLVNQADHESMNSYFRTESWRGPFPETELPEGKGMKASKPPELLEGKGM